MVHDLCPGDKWVPETIIERTGPLSYLVQVSGGQTWKKHIGHLRQMTDSPQEEENFISNKESFMRYPQTIVTVPNQLQYQTLLMYHTTKYPRRKHVPPDRLIHYIGVIYFLSI